MPSMRAGMRNEDADAAADVGTFAGVSSALSRTAGTNAKGMSADASGSDAVL